jgi:hypothetical protein
MAKGHTYEDYLIELANQDRAWHAAVKAGDTDARNKIENEEQNIYYNAYVDGIDPWQMYRDVFVEVHGRQPTEPEMKNADRSLNEILLIREYLDTLNRLRTAPDWETDNIEGELQAILLRDLGNGMDGYEMSYQALWILNGERPTAAQIAENKPRVDKAYASYNALNAEAKKELIAPRPSRDTKRPIVSPFSYHDRWGETYSGADMVVFMAFPGYKPIEIGTASTVSYTTYREKKQVRTLGRISAKGITKGTRTISGRLIFTVIAEHIVESIRREVPYLRDIKTILMDELPPFDLLVSFGNEYGSGAGLVIQGITTVDEQKTLSIEDLFTENIFTYLAMALEPMRDMHASNIAEAYDPLDWYTSDFRAPWSEALAKFKVKDLMVYKETLLLQDPQPFIGGPAEWDSAAAPTIANSASGSTGGSNPGGDTGGAPAPIPNTGGDTGGDTGDGGTGGGGGGAPKHTGVFGYGYWFDQGATTSCCFPVDEKRVPNTTPQPSVRVYDANEKPIEGLTVDWYYSIPDFDKVKEYPAWTLANDSYGMKVTSATGKTGSSKTNKNGTSTMPEYDFGNFPESCTVYMTAKAQKSKTDKGHVASSQWVKFCFYMKPKRDFK